jgi:hypothetical protein
MFLNFIKLTKLFESSEFASPYTIPYSNATLPDTVRSIKEMLRRVPALQQARRVAVDVASNSGWIDSSKIDNTEARK